MNKEDFIIQAFLNEKNGDDGAIINQWCYSKDLFFENIHFKREWLTLEQIATKAMLVNISDAIVMNAEPKYALLGLALPNLNHEEIKALQKGFLKTAKKFGMQIIGGDTIYNDKIDISITIISKIRKKAVFRKGLKIGHLLAYTGKLGESLKGLEILQNGGKLNLNHRFIKPKLRSDFFYEIAPFISCAMDISDGLSKDLSRLLAKNECGIEWLKKLDDYTLYSGEEYEILFAFDKTQYLNIEQIAKKHHVKLNIFAKAVKGKYEFSGREHHF
ncbi:thiamine-phosphate kinase [Campylobacter molothri]|uniref:thiamine-phosphate kinase n=1 Tax=Campylobacter molothri TaxID=1032242 RepID=UPI001EFAE9E6|nr:thiamine-phosphate kinase [Campylobacter sp. RM10537]MBZ7948815.1 thiamine-phosphate kinase [Campylobacter sp. RM10534]ULO00282.1 thiamine monophosphate kinase [Campylobacter sp. RM10537]